MNAVLLYRRRQRWQIWAAFALAAAIHIGAVAIAASVSRGTAPANSDPVDSWIDAFDPGEPPPPETEALTVPEQPVVSKQDDMFTDDNPRPPETRPRKTKIVTPSSSRAIGTSSRPASFSYSKALALSAPRPEYPYEARRQRTTGSGIATLTIDSISGTIIDVSMSQSTGSSVLDNATINGLRRWRFKNGTVTRVQVPITYTLSGATY